MRSVLATILLLTSCVPLLAQKVELEEGQVLFSVGWKDQRVRTSEFEIRITFDTNSKEHQYRIKFLEAHTGTLKEHVFEFANELPQPVALNIARRCDKRIIFLTLRFPPPIHADIRGYQVETHAFLRETFSYLDTAPVAFEDIALQQAGADLGWSYLAPQPYQYYCLETANVLEFRPTASSASE